MLEDQYQVQETINISWLRVNFKSEDHDIGVSVGACGDTEQLTRVGGQIAVHHPSKRDGLEIFDIIQNKIYFSSRLSHSPYLF